MAGAGGGGRVAGVGVGAGAGVVAGAGAGVGAGVSDGASLQPTANEVAKIKITSKVKYFFILILLNLQNWNFFAFYLFTNSITWGFEKCYLTLMKKVLGLW
jgi:hypothetical protein